MLEEKGFTTFVLHLSYTFRCKMKAVQNTQIIATFPDSIWNRKLTSYRNRLANQAKIFLVPVICLTLESSVRFFESKNVDFLNSQAGFSRMYISYGLRSQYEHFYHNQAYAVTVGYSRVL